MPGGGRNLKGAGPGWEVPANGAGRGRPRMTVPDIVVDGQDRGRDRLGAASDRPEVASGDRGGGGTSQA